MNFSQKSIHLLQENSCPKQPFESVLRKASTTIPERYLTIDELKVTFFFLKMKKSTGADEISFNLIKNCFGELSDIFTYAFDYLCKRRHFQILWRLQKWPLYLKLVTLRKLVITAVSCLPCFTKILKRIMHDHLFSYLFNKKIYYIRSSLASKKVIPQSMLLLI